MRKFVSAIAVVSLVTVSSAFAADTLAPGKPAGVQKAQGFGMTEWLVFGTIVGVGVGVAIATSGGRASAMNQGQTITQTSLSTS